MPRSLTIVMPNGRTEYWFTERVFEVGRRHVRPQRRDVGCGIGETDLRPASTCDRQAHDRHRPSRRLALDVPGRGGRPGLRMYHLDPFGKRA